ncbi:3,4-dihydroxy-2-butanone-4-phosphate synthase [Halobacterium litoreum]|uniref:3,4-dihydroxy-2-butanone 4-phosphate synthase n=1 Tax=Halobacterium litoreum TaxID=2039234 RepID=A0ABD5NE90_9EURY|nr:3,4-dihydroxy-2-butanone-4-phosphate synthase [Halobacterium litoreum]UHH13556.1 3,4-dihydroxy-2-butanone-4-phosphate synthase [Halobacterium litoreum]
MSKSSNATGVERAVDAFADGDPVLVHDAADREGEVDLIYPAEAVAPDDVARLRNDAGGLVCVALGSEAADAFDLPFLADELDHPAADHGHLGYDDRSSFSLPVNHRDTFTGITDADRALTISELGRAAADPDSVDFAETFRAPGHVHVLRAAPSLADRLGHTELGVALADEAGVAPAAVVCEMLDDETGDARSVADAKAYADRHDLVYVEGSELVAALAE